MITRFEWDPDKAESNLRKHGVSFPTATLVFSDPRALMEQDRIVEGEERWQALGLAGDALMLLVAPLAGEDDGVEVIRIVSAREANPKERRRYEQAYDSL